MLTLAIGKIGEKGIKSLIYLDSQEKLYIQRQIQ